MQLSSTFEKDFDDLYYSYTQDSDKLKLLKTEGISPEQIDVGNMSRLYFENTHVADMSIDKNANANEEISPTNYQSEITKGILKLEGYYLLWKYANKRFGKDKADEMIRAIWDGDVYFHDASGPLMQTIYCYAFSTSQIMTEGRPYGQLKSLPPKRSDSFAAQVTEVCMDLSQDIAGAVAPSDFIVNLCYYLKNENIDPESEEGKYYILNLWQKFVHVMNNKFRVSGQSPFTNISIFDMPNLQKVFGEIGYPDGSKPDFDYIMKVQKLIAEFHSKGDPASGYTLPYRFPVMTVNIMVDANKNIQDKDFLDFISRINIDKGVFNIYINDGVKIATCCRLINNFERMKFRIDSFGNGGLNIGSDRVITINFPRIALKADGDIDAYYDELTRILDLVKDMHLVHREEIVQRRIDGGFLKFFKPLQWFSPKSLFSTMGATGLYESAFYMHRPMETEEGQKFIGEVLDYVEGVLDMYTDTTGYSFNLEEVPAESSAVALAQKDRILFGDLPFELYSNQYLPLIADVDPVDRIVISGKFMEKMSGGGIVHINIAEKITDPVIMENLIKFAIKYGTTHFAINYGFGTCAQGHTTISGNPDTCPICGDKMVEYMTRVIGYFTKVSSWNSVRRDYEWKKRVFK